MAAPLKSKEEALGWLDKAAQKLIGSRKIVKVRLTRDRTNSITGRQGIYLVSENAKIVYVGESGCIRKRMVDLLDSKHHQLRRNVGERLFNKSRGFKKASSKDRFPLHIEKALDTYIEKSLRIAAFPVYKRQKNVTG